MPVYCLPFTGYCCPVDEFRPEHLKGSQVGFAPGADNDVARRVRELYITPPNLLEPPAQTIAGHRGQLEPGNDQSKSRVAHCVIDPKQVQMFGPAAPSTAYTTPQIRVPCEPVRARQALLLPQEPPCFDGRATASRFRPFLRRRDSTARPQRVAIRARNPCLLMRLRLRGRYDGFMSRLLR